MCVQERKRESVCVYKRERKKERVCVQERKRVCVCHRVREREREMSPSLFHLRIFFLVFAQLYSRVISMLCTLHDKKVSKTKSNPIELTF